MHRHPFFTYSLILLLVSSTHVCAAEEQTPVNTILTQWSAASRFLSPVTPQSAVEQFKQQNQAYFSGHEIALFSEFQQPVSLEKLKTEYRWKLMSQSQSRIVLQGQPQDALTRRLCRPFELQINARSMLPESLTFLTRESAQKDRFASIELTALKVTPTTRIHTSPEPQFVRQTVAKAVFPAVQPVPAGQSPIKRVAFTSDNDTERNPTERLQIEKLVTRWITETSRIDSVRLGNGITIFKRNQRQTDVKMPPTYRSTSDSRASEKQALQEVLPGWLIDVDQKSFQIESFTIELDAESAEAASPWFVTLKLKPHPDAPRPDWESVELEFSSRQALPIRISETRNDRISEFLLSDVQVHYAK